MRLDDYKSHSLYKPVRCELKYTIHVSMYIASYLANYVDRANYMAVYNWQSLVDE